MKKQQQKLNKRRKPKYTTLLEQFKNIPHCWNSSKIYHTVGTVKKYTTLLEQFKNIPHCWNSSKIYHTVGTVQKYTTLLEQFKNILEKIKETESNA